MYYALAKVAKEQFGLDDVAKEFIELGNQETNHGAFYASLNGRYPYDEKTFWQMVRGLSKAEYKGEDNINKLADKLASMGVDEAIINKYAPKENDNNSNKPVYVCKVCGFEYVGDLDKEPDDYKCPICAMPKTAFEKKIL